VRPHAAQAVKEVPGLRSELVHQPLLQDDSTRRQHGIALARERLLWASQVELTEGFRPTMHYLHALWQRSD
jgi:UDP-glucuronate decarboxylase